jgi:small conductance mechanosensitive channel
MLDWLLDLDRWRDFWRDHDDRIVDGVVSVAIVVVLFMVLNVFLRRLVRRLVRTVVTRAESSRRRDAAGIRSRADTMAATIAWVVQIFLLFLGVSLVLSEFGFNITAVAAGLGVAGLGLGLGAQSLVRDVINGMFILIEDQFGVGDVVQVLTTNGQTISGAVEEVNPRRTVLRDMSGNVHVIPNSAILVATNMTQDYSRINLDIAIAFEENLDHVIGVINDECAKLASDFPEDIVSMPAVLRVDSLTANGVTLKIIGDTKISRQWDLMGELRRRIKDRFDAEGIEIPYPHRTTLIKNAPPAAAGETQDQERVASARETDRPG